MNQSISQEGSSVDGSFASDYGVLKPTRFPNILVIVGIAATYVASIYCGWGDKTLPDFAAWTSTLCLLVSLLAAIFVTPRVYSMGFLISLLPFLIAWRVAAMNSATVLEWVASIAFILILLQFIDCVISDVKRSRWRAGAWFTTLLWQATIVRLYFGLNELGHSVEKIFAGRASYDNLVHLFQSLGSSQAGVLVVIAGLIELGAAISIGLGLFARLGALCGMIYFLVATIGYGGEWGRGYAWATAGGGGWEYVMLILVYFGSVVMAGAGKFSIDGWLLNRGLLRGPLAYLASNCSGIPSR